MFKKVGTDSLVRPNGRTAQQAVAPYHRKKVALKFPLRRIR